MQIFVATKGGRSVCIGRKCCWRNTASAASSLGHVIIFGFRHHRRRPADRGSADQHPEAATSEAFQLGYPDGAVSPGNGQRPGQPGGKLRFYTDADVKAATEQAKAVLGKTGRIVVRVSGTEPLIRVMVEGEQEETINRLANEVADVIREKLV